MRKRLFSLFLLIFAGFVLVACNKDKVDLNEIQAATYEAVFQGEDTIDSVTQNMVFKTTSDKHKDVTIVWLSDNTAVVSNTGVVKRQAEDKNVKISFEIKYKKETLPKDFVVTVKKTETPIPEELYSITLPDNVTSTHVEDIAKDTEVTLTITPPVGQMLDTLIVADEDVTSKVENNTYKFKVTSNVVVKVTFKNEPNPEDRFSITLPDFGVDASQTENIVSGTEVTLTITPDDGEVLESLKLNGKDFTDGVVNNKFTFIVSEDVTVTVTFRQAIDEDVLDIVATYLKNLYHEEYVFQTNEEIDLLEEYLDTTITWDLGVYANDGKWVVTEDTTVTVDAKLEYNGDTANITLSFIVKYIEPQEGEEQLLFETGFEEEEEGYIGNKNANGDYIYINHEEYITGPKDNEFAFVAGTPSISSFPITGAQSAQIRYSPKNNKTLFGYIKNDFEIDNFSKITFKAKSTDSLYHLKVEVSNTGENWYRGEEFTLTKGEAKEFTYINTRDYYKFFRISIVVRGDAGESKAAGFLLDDLKVYGFRVPVPTATVTLDYGYDNKVETEDVAIGNTFDLPNEPVRPGYNFKHWVLKGTDTAYDFNTVISEDITLVAIWEKETYTVTILSEGISVSKEENIELNEIIIISITPEDGEVLDVLKVNGKDLTEGVVNNKLEFTVTGNVTISATFKPNYGNEVIEEVADHLRTIYPEGYVFLSNVEIDLLETYLGATIEWDLGRFAEDGRWVVTEDTQATVVAVIAFDDVEVSIEFEFVIRFVDPTFTEQVIYETGFEKEDGFINKEVFNNQLEINHGNDLNQFGILSGTISTNKAITGTQSVQIRSYTQNKNTYGYVTNKFELNNFSKLVFNAKNTKDGIKIKVEVSIDGVNWVNEVIYDLKNESYSYTYINKLVDAKYFKVTIATEVNINNSGSGFILDDLQVFGYKKPLEVYDVTFDPNYDGSSVEKVSVTQGNKVDVPEVPVRPGYKFLHWTSNKENNEIFDFETIINDHLILYAVWEEIVVKEITVFTENEFINALGSNTIETINLGADIVVSKALIIANKNKLTINGAGLTLSFAEDLTGWQGNYIIKVWKSIDVSIENIKFDGGDAAIYVASSTISVKDITLTNHEYGGIEVFESVDNLKPKLTVLNKVTVDFETKVPVIWIDGKTENNDFVVDKESQFTLEVFENQLWFVIIEDIVENATYIEDFSNFIVTDQSYKNGSFVGVNSRLWTYVKVRGDLTVNNKKALTLQGKNNSSIKTTLSQGLSELVFDYNNGFSKTADVEVWINGIKVSTISGKSTVQNLKLSNLEYKGEVTIEIKSVKNQMNISPIQWTENN